MRLTYVYAPPLLQEIILKYMVTFTKDRAGFRIAHNIF